MTGRIMRIIAKNTIKSNRYKIINKINILYLVDFIDYFILIGRQLGPIPPSNRGEGAAVDCGMRVRKP